MTEETTMFDLFPDVERLMLDTDAPHAAHHRAIATQTPRRLPLEGARRALGRRLIAIGSALAVDERAPERSLAR
jgi:hypothetical protein